jgi:integrase/recombinase XerC
MIPFAGELYREFEAYIAARSSFSGGPDGALFLSAKGGRISRSAVYRMVNSQLKGRCATKKCSPHVLRHSFATAMLNNGAEIGVVKELLGHKRLATTEIYTHLTFEELKKTYEKAHPRAGIN